MRTMTGGERLLRRMIREIAASRSGLTRTIVPNYVQWGGFALRPDAGVQTREDDPVKNRAACVLIRRGGKVLAVSRKDDMTAMGIPGGKVDPEDGAPGMIETLATAAARELREETGLSVPPNRLRFVYESQEDDGYTTTTFEALWSDVRGPIRTAEVGRVRWIDPSELITGPFGRYNADMLAAAAALPPLDCTPRNHTVSNKF